MRPPRALRRSMARARYRAGQVARGFRSRLSPREVEAVRGLLTPEELRLFAAMHPRDRRHSVDVLRWLEVTAGSVPPSRELRRAALLHDVGKGRPALWERVAFVLLAAISPRVVDALARREGASWQRALWALRHHAALGAERLAAAGAGARVVALVGGHTIAGRAGDPELNRLIEADQAS